MKKFFILTTIIFSLTFLTGCENPQERENKLNTEPNEVSTSTSDYKMHAYLTTSGNMFEIASY